MTGFIPKEKLTAYQRWELAAFDEAEQAAAKAEKADEAAPVDSPPQPEEPPVVLPTAADIERMHNEAHEQGYAAGYAEGIADAQAVADQISAILGTLQQAVGDLDQHIADQLLATAIEIASQVLRQSLRVNPELLLPVVRGRGADPGADGRSSGAQQLAHHRGSLPHPRRLPGRAGRQRGRRDAGNPLETGHRSHRRQPGLAERQALSIATP